MSIVIVSQKGSIVIPKALRQKYGLQPGVRVKIVDYGGGMSLFPLPDDPVRALRGLCVDGPSLTADLLADRQRVEKQGEV